MVNRMLGFHVFALSRDRAERRMMGINQIDVLCMATLTRFAQTGETSVGQLLGCYPAAFGALPARRRVRRLRCVLLTLEVCVRFQLGAMHPLLVMR